MIPWGHRGAVGKTQTGKTVFENARHVGRVGTGRLMSIFVDTKNDYKIGKVQGRVVHGDGQDVLAQAVKYRVVTWPPPRTGRRGQFGALVAELHRVGNKLRRPLGRVHVDEAQQYANPGVSRGDNYTFDEAPAEVAASELQQLGWEFTWISQDTMGFSPIMRKNTETWHVFRVVDEALGAMRANRWPVDDWKKHLARPYHFLSYTGTETLFHPPIPHKGNQS